MIDLFAEKLLTLEQASKKLFVNPSTIFRWITVGTKGIKLEGVMLGTRWRTSEEAIQRYADRLTPDQEPTPSPQSDFRTQTQRRRDQERDEDRLDKWFGIKKCESCRIVINAANVVIPKNEKLWCPQCMIKRKSATLGQRIRMFRWCASLSQQTLGDRSGMKLDFVRAYEFDRRKPSEAHLAKLIDVLGQDLVSGLKGYSEEGQTETDDEGTS